MLKKLGSGEIIKPAAFYMPKMRNVWFEIGQNWRKKGKGNGRGLRITV